MGKNILKFILISLLASPVLFLINTGFLTLNIFSFFQTTLFVTVIGISFVWAYIRKYMLLFSLCFLMLTAIFYILDYIDWADMTGSTGIGVLTVVLTSYIPQLIKLGYIKKV